MTRLLKQGSTWLDRQHPEYQRHVERWHFAWEHYSLAVLDREIMQNHLKRKASAESEAAYLERVHVADYTPHFSTVADALAGMLFAVEGQAKRFLGDEKRPGLGSFEDPTTSMHRLWRDADGQRTSWLTLFKQLTIRLIVQHRAWLIVDQDDDGNALVRLWPATAVVNWWFDSQGRLAQVLVTEMADQRADIKADTRDIRQRWVLYTLEGWERWEKDDSGQPKKVDESAWATPFVDEDGREILPIFPVELPLERPVGYSLAKKCNAIFNRESERDNLLRTANFPLLIIVGTDEQYKAAVVEVKRGVRALRHDPAYGTTHQFIAPDGANATVATEVLKRKVEEFYVNAFREYGDAARERTATEVKQDVASGVGAFLQLLKSAVDDAENQTLFRAAQIELPTQRNAWFINRVERSDSFAPVDVQAVIEATRTRYFGKDAVVPLGFSGLMNLAKQIARYDGIEVDENEIRSALMTGEYHRLVSLFRELPVPASVRVRMTMELLTTAGFVDVEEKVKMADGTERPLIEQLQEEMLNLAMADDEARKRAAQPLEI